MSYPNLKNKHLYKSYFSAKDFITYSKKSKDWKEFENPKIVILIYSSKLLKYILEKYKTEHIEIFGDFYLLKNMSVGIFKIDGIGAPVAVTSLEEMIALGIDTFINFGTAGGLQEKSSIGDLVLCTKAIRDEGVSHHYIKSSMYSYPTKDLTLKLEEIFNKSDIKYIKGGSWTIDTPYRETVDEINHYKDLGILTVEMETSALFSVCQLRKVNIASCFIISDSLVDLEWNPQFGSDILVNSLKHVLNTIIKMK